MNLRVLRLLALGTLAVAPPCRAEEIAPSRVSLPDGPGSVLGLGSTFEPNAGTGTLGFALPIEVPPGAGGLAPTLSLRYDGGAGQGLLGLGWSLSGLPAVRLSTRRGVPRLDGTDRVEVVGFGPPAELLPLANGFHRPAFEGGAFVRAERSRDGRVWELRDKAGRIYRFGGAATCEENGRVVEWLPTQILDRHGHRLTLEWAIEAGVGRPVRIAYNEFGAEVENTVEFDYVPRPDPREGFETGMRRRDSHRLTRVRTTHGGRTVRTWELAYAPGGRTLLSGLAVTGAAGERLPDLSFEYTPVSPTPVIRDLEAGPPHSPDQGDVAFVDLDGDALPDVLVAEAGRYRSYRNADGHRFEDPRDWGGPESPSFSLLDPGSTLADLDGDGALDLLTRAVDGRMSYLPGGPHGRFGPAVALGGPTAPDVDAPESRLADFDGDRRVDIAVATRAGLQIAYNEGGRGFASPRLVPWPAGAEEALFGEPGWDLCEVNGDGLPDLCRVRSGAMTYWLGRGRGHFEPGRAANGVPAFEDHAPFRLHDVDGDGRDDLVHFGVGRLALALAQADGEFGEPVAFDELPASGEGRYVGLHDLDGSGTVEVVFVNRAAAAGTAAWRIVELLPEGRPGLLTRIVDGRGVERRFAYASATAARVPSEAEDDRVDDGEPGRQNLPMTVLVRTETRTAFGDPEMVETFAYGGGTWDPEDRAFGGFRHVVRRSMGSTPATTLVLRQTLSAGLEHPAMRGVVLSASAEDGEGRSFRRTTDTWRVDEIDVGANGEAVRFAWRAREDVVELEGEPDGRLSRTEFTLDAHGNEIRLSQWGEVVGEDVRAGGDETVTVRRFAEDVDEWILGAPASEEVQDADGRRLRATRSFYDGPPHEGLPAGRILRGNLSRREAWVADDDWALVESHAYDAEGHVVESRDGAGGRRTFVWDAADHTFLREERVHLSEQTLSWQSRSDRATGAVVESVAPGGERRTRRVDAFGRPTMEWLEGDSERLPTRSFTYHDEGPLPRVVVTARRTSGEDAVDHVETLSDGLGRARGQLVRHPDGRWVLLGATGFDARGHEIGRQNGRVLDGPEAVFGALAEPGPARRTTYDALGRPVEVLSAAGRRERFAYGPWRTLFWHGGQVDPESTYEHTPSARTLDGRGRVVALEETLDGQTLVTRFRWDAAGALIAKTDPLGRTSTYEYDGRGRRTAVVDPDAGRFGFEYDGASRLVARVHPDGQVVRYGWDAAGRAVTTDDDGDGAPEVRRIWDETHPGRLARVEDSVGTQAFEYDARGRIACTTRTIDAASYRTCSHYDAQDRVVGHGHPDGSATMWQVDALGRTVRIDDLAAIERDPDGRLLALGYETGLREESGYDPDGLLVRRDVFDASDGAIERMSWTWDAARAVAARARAAADAVEAETFEYDNLGRLRSARGPDGDTTWTYDGAGPLRSRTSDAPEMDAGEAAYDERHPSTPQRFGAVALEWDARRRLVHDGARRYTWGPDDRLHRIEHTDGRTVESRFDAEGARRVETLRDSTGTERRTVYLGEFDEIRDGELVRYVTLDGRRIARLDPLRWSDSSEGAETMRGFGLFGLLLGVVAVVRRRGSFGFASVSLTVVLACTEVVERRTAGEGQDADGSAGAETDAGRTDSGPMPSDATGAADGPPTPETHEIGPARFVHDPVGTLVRVLDPDGRPLAVHRAHPYGVPRVDTTAESIRFAGLMHDALGVAFTPARVYVPELELWASLDPVAVDSPERQVEEALLLAPTYAYASGRPLASIDVTGTWTLSVAGGVAMGGSLSRLFPTLSKVITEQFGLGGSGAAGVAVEFDGAEPTRWEGIASVGTGTVVSRDANGIAPFGQISIAAGGVDDLVGPSNAIGFSVPYRKVSIGVSATWGSLTLTVAPRSDHPAVGWEHSETRLLTNSREADWQPAPGTLERARAAGWTP
jgi:RHS repeat-associated protein